MASTSDKPLDLTSRLLVSVDEAGAVLGISRSSIYRCFEEGLLTALRVGRRTVISTDDLRKFSASLQEAPVRRPATIQPKAPNRRRAG